MAQFYVLIIGSVHTLFWIVGYGQVRNCYSVSVTKLQRFIRTVTSQGSSSSLVMTKHFLLKTDSTKKIHVNRPSKLPGPYNIYNIRLHYNLWNDCSKLTLIFVVFSWPQVLSFSPAHHLIDLPQWENMEDRSLTCITGPRMVLKWKVWNVWISFATFGMWNRSQQHCWLFRGVEDSWSYWQMWLSIVRFVPTSRNVDGIVVGMSGVPSDDVWCVFSVQGTRGLVAHAFAALILFLCHTEMHLLPFSLL